MDEHDVRAEARSERSRASGRLIGTGLVILGLVLFIGQNTETVDVNWLFLSGDAPLWLMLVLAAVAGAIISWGLGVTLRRRRRRRED